MASNARKQGGRVTAKGTQPPAKKRATVGPAAPAAGGTGKQKGADAPADLVTQGPNRQMRRAGMNLEQQEPDKGRMKLILGSAAGVAALMVILCLVLYRVSGTWIGILGVAAGVAVGFAVATGKEPYASRGRQIAIGLVVVGVLLSAVGAANVIDWHWPFFALIGCAVGAFFIEMFVQQMTAPTGPPASAVALLKRSGAQLLEVPSSGGAVWATTDGRIRLIIGATLEDGTTSETVTVDRNVRKSRQRAVMLQRRLSAIGAEEGLICVVDSAITTTRDGDDIICSAAGLTKALSR